MNKTILLKSLSLLIIVSLFISPASGATVSFISSPPVVGGQYTYEFAPMVWEFSASESNNYVALLDMQMLENYYIPVFQHPIPVDFDIGTLTGSFSVDLEQIDFPYEVNEEFPNGAEYFVRLTVVIDDGTGSYSPVTGGMFFMFLHLPERPQQDPDVMLMDLIQDVKATSAKNRGTTQSLVSQLDQALVHYENAELNDAVDKLEHFIKKVNKYAQGGKISGSDASSLILSAEDIIGAILE